MNGDPTVSCPTCQVPVHTQFASSDLVGPIVEGGLDPASDPAWAESGAKSPAEYARWAGHLCGMTCLRMALGADAPSLFALRDGALEYGAYTEDGDGEIRGWSTPRSPRTYVRSTVWRPPSTGISHRRRSWTCWTRAGSSWRRCTTRSVTRGGPHRDEAAIWCS